MSSNRPSEVIKLPASSSLALLRQARKRYTQKEIGTKLDVTSKTIARWEQEETPCPQIVEAALKNMLAAPAGTATPPCFSFIDLFAGIGGVRLGFESAGGQCVFTSEWND